MEQAFISAANYECDQSTVDTIQTLYEKGNST